jgi:hypothetical protein
MTPLSYSRTVETHGIKVPLVEGVISERMERVMERGRYDSGEVRILRRVLRPTDRVLELGAGIGLVSTAAAEINGPENVVAKEANPNLVPLIAEIHKLNDLSSLQVLNGLGVTHPASSGIRVIR